MSLITYCLLVFLIVCALCWKWYDDEPGAKPDAETDAKSVAQDLNEGT
jgi:hypothetical protein